MLFLAAVTALRADDWPQWMGPKRDNVWREAGILESFPAAGPNVLWRAKIANGFSGPAVAGGLVFVTDFVSKADISADNFDRVQYDGQERVMCFDAKSGEARWKHGYDVNYTVSYPNGPRCTPVVDAGKVYTLGAEGHLFCFDAKTGKIEWSRELKKSYGVNSPLWGFAAHPLIDGDRLICMVGGKGSVAVAFDKNTGKEIWKSLSADEPGYSPPMIVEGKTRQLIIWHPESINSLDPATGSVYWTVKQPTVNGTSIMSPRVFENQLFIGAWQRKGLLLKIDTDKPAAKSVWKGDRDSAVYPVNNTPIIDGGFIYGVCTDGELRCVDIKDGERKWESYKPVAGEKAQSGTAHIVKNGDRFFIANEKGDLVIAKLTPKGYDEVGRWHMLAATSKAFGRDVLWAHPAFAQQCAFARNDKELICVSLAK
jgi:outer membrane protein assembly factor BamB